MEKVYLDYNIWQEMYKSEKTRTYFMSKNDWEYYISVAHFEELFHARNNETEVYKGDAEGLRSLMLQLSKHGILNYTLDGIKFFQDDAEIAKAIYTIEKNHNTQEDIKTFALNKFINLQGGDVINSIAGIKQEDLYKKIWEHETVVGLINKLNVAKKESKHVLPLLRSEPTLAIQLMPPTFVSEYTKDGLNSEVIELANNIIISLTTEIQPNQFENIKSNYLILEDIVEMLYNILDNVGFKRDKKERTAISGVYDTQHSIMSTYCDVFITKDKKFKERYRAVAWYLGIPIKILRWDGKDLQ